MAINRVSHGNLRRELLIVIGRYQEDQYELRRVVLKAQRLLKDGDVALQALKAADAALTSLLEEGKTNGDDRLDEALLG